MILLDTSALIDCCSGPKRSGLRLTGLVTAGEQVRIPTLVLYEWLRGPRTPDELEDQQSIFPAHHIIPFGTEEAALSARLYRSLGRARSRAIDIAIAACAIRHDSELWTLNKADFADIPGLRLYAAEAP